MAFGLRTDLCGQNDFGVGGKSLGWIAVILIAIASVSVSIYKIHNTGIRWVFAFNFGLLVGIIYGGIDLICVSL
jgi:hypothetical protein